ncbi:MAG: DNA polymerase III subunit gamma/tau [Nitrospirota bacterium]|jgi:DNA polymerase-3 subunit gamma/tau
MSYLVLARKWRPQGFDQLIGQTPIVRILKNSISQGKTAHAYVFSGPRGVGKTSTARILAKSLNCEEGPTPSPCGRCPSCRAIAEGHSVDVLEIDGASNNSVENIRDLRDRVKYAPSGGRYKIYIIDETHMLSNAAFNALLKTLEEPPPHVIFVLATTEPKKIPLTVMSRCQHLPFRRVSTQAIKERLGEIAAAEGISITEGALGMVARAADGSIRDSLTILDQVTAFSSEVRESDIKSLLDLADFPLLTEVARAAIGGDKGKTLMLVATLVERGTDLRVFARDLTKFFRDLLVAATVKEAEEARDTLDLSDEELQAMKSLVSRTSPEHLALILSELIRAEADVRMSFSPRVALEMALIKISLLSAFRSVNEALAALSRMEENVGGDVPLDAASPAQEAPAPSPASPGEEPEPETPTAEDEHPLPEAPEPFPEAPEPFPETPEPPPEPFPEEYGEPLLAEDEPPEDRESEEPPAGPDVLTYTGESLREAIASRLEDRLSSRLSVAQARLEGDTLVLTFRSSDAAICASPFEENPSVLAEHATRLRGIPTKVAIEVKPERARSRVKDLKKKALAEPLVKEALDLFEGRVVNVKEIDEEQ